MQTMNKQLFTMAAIVIGLSFSACTKVTGDGPVIKENRTATNFSSIRNAMSGDVYLRQDSIFKVEVHAQQNILDIINTTVSGGELKIDYDYNKRIGRHEKVEIFISCPNISALYVSGSGSITGMNNFSAASLLEMTVSGSGSISIPEINTSNISAKVSGSGDIVILNGSSGEINTDISGSGYLDFLGVKCASAEVKISGSGDTKVNVSEDLNVRISGSGDVYYRGRPRISTNISGSGKLIAL